jgi:hypothetical protein
MIGFASKKTLKEAIASGALLNRDASRFFIETSLLGTEYRSNGILTVCMDHPKRSKFANVTVKDDRIIGVR